MYLVGQTLSTFIKCASQIFVLISVILHTDSFEKYFLNVFQLIIAVRIRIFPSGKHQMNL